MTEIEVGQAIANLDAYLDTWTDGEGGLHGYVIHHHRDYAVLISPTTWAQSVRILSHIVLWEKTRDRHWLEKVQKEGSYLVASYNWEEHLFRDSTTPLSLINVAWPCLALFKTAITLKSAGLDGWEDLEKAGRDCLEERIFRLHWDESVGDFFFCPPNFSSKRVHTYNQSAITISAICALAEITGERDLVDRYAVPAADNMVANQIIGFETELDGGWGYNDGSSSHLFYYLYTALNCRGLLDIYEFTGEKKYLKSAEDAAGHLQGLIDEKSKLFSHRMERKGKNGTLFTHPVMISTSGLGLLQMRRLVRHGMDLDVGENILALLSHQQSHGGFPSFIGITDIWTPQMYPCEPDKRKWRDILCVPFWVVFTLELLVDLLPEGSVIPSPHVEDSLDTKTDDGYEVQENSSRVRLIKDGKTVAYFVKVDDTMLFSTEPMRGVPFGAFANEPMAALKRAQKRLKLGGAAGAVVILIQALLIIYLL